ncbi:MAG TPA: LysM peptidoglycan-binding domain-containing protein [Candidatus Saccharimonadales bacterium]|nr:LysM peptidoglycan-binding domain-containing protein [Candidatus Saccharimonadales bacterium]
MGVNLLILIAIAVMVLGNPHAGSIDTPAVNSSRASAPVNPLDQVSSTDIALTVARATSLAETTAINNQAQSQAANIAISTSNNSVTTKPEVIATALKSRADIFSYVVKPGDTISGLATRFGITSDSIRWSNEVSGDTVPVGTKLWIPPVNGIVYVVKTGDTADSLATRFNASKQQILAYNDGEISGLHVGERIIIPNASQNATTAAGIAAGSGIAGGAAFPWGSGPLYGYNGYDYGYCTWYVATQINVPANWGNAATWAYYARQSGWNVGRSPSVGSIAQLGSQAAGGYGHVAVVEAISADGSRVRYRDMNGVAGWGNVGHSGWVSVSHFDNYIRR